MISTGQDARLLFTPRAEVCATLGGSLRVKGIGVPSGRPARFVLVAFLVVLAVCLPAPSFAVAGTGHEFEKVFGPCGNAACHFEQPGAVAVDQATHDVYVASYGFSGTGGDTVERFDQNGAPVNFSALSTNKIANFNFGATEALHEIAVDSTSHAFYVAELSGIQAFQQSGEPFEFTAGPGAGSSKLPAFSEVCGVAVDSSGDIYMADFATGVHIFEPDGEEITSFSAPEACNLAVASHGVVYVSHYPFLGSPGIEKFTPSEFPVTTGTSYLTGGLVDAEKTFALAVDPSTNDLYVVEHPEVGKSRVAQYDESGARLGAFAETGSGALNTSEGVTVDGATGNVYASDIAGEQQVEIWAPPPPEPPSIGSTTATSITATSAKLLAQIDPNSFDTKYHFEYLTEAEYQANGEKFTGAQSTPETDLVCTSMCTFRRMKILGVWRPLI